MCSDNTLIAWSKRENCNVSLVLFEEFVECARERGIASRHLCFLRKRYIVG